MEKNPYDILGVSSAASKAEIIKAVAVAIKLKQYPVTVIAKAQKSLMKSEERIIADYLRPILPTIRQFKYSDLTDLNQPVPTLELLSEFDGLDNAIAQATRQENLEKETVPIPLPQLFKEGVMACKEGNYPKAIKYLEEYCQGCKNRNSQNYLQATMWLIKAYQVGGEFKKAIALCKSLSNHEHTQVNTWAKKILAILYKEIPVSDLNPTYLINQKLRDLLIKEISEIKKEKVVLQQLLREQQTQTAAQTEDLFLELLEVADALEALLTYLENNPNPSPEFIERLPRSVAAVNRKFLSVLGKRQLIPIEIEAGAEPDFNLCRVIDREERTDVADQTITKIVRRGFRWGEKILRPTEVITAKVESNLDGNIDETIK
jgi:molecular chaperone GrpE